MFDTPTTAFCHQGQENGKNKSFFTIFPTISSLNIPLSGYFQQQETRASPSADTIIISPNDPITTVPSPAAPQQPTHNRRTQRRLPSKPTSVSTNIAATASQRSVLPPNMGNISSSSSVAQSSKASSPVAQSSKASSSGNHHHRRKKHLNKINRKKVDEAITLSAFAVEEDNQGNHENAMNHYLSALENMLEALPIHSNQSRKDALKNKLRDFMDREGLTDDFMESTNASSIAKAAEREEFKPSTDGKSGISQHIIQAAITSAVALKQSPIPDAISATVNYTMKKIQRIDQTYGLQNKAWEISRTGINLALEIDQQYNVHEKVGNALFTGIAAAMKAGIAYKDSPSYRELQKMRTDFEYAGTSSNHNVC